MREAPVLRCRGIGCGRPLTDPKSRSRGYGPACWDEYVTAHPELATPRRRRPTTVPKPRPASEPMPGQEDLFELSEFPITDVGV